LILGPSWPRLNGRLGSRAALAGHLVVRPVYLQLRKQPLRSGTCVPCLDNIASHIHLPSGHRPLMGKADRERRRQAPAKERPRPEARCICTSSCRHATAFPARSGALRQSDHKASIRGSHVSGQRAPYRLLAIRNQVSAFEATTTTRLLWVTGGCGRSADGTAAVPPSFENNPSVPGRTFVLKAGMLTEGCAEPRVPGNLQEDWRDRWRLGTYL